MTLSAKIVAGGVLTFFMFGIIQLFQHWQFIVPFPFISEFVLVLIVLVISQNLKSFGWKSIPFYAYAVSGSLSGRFIWEILLPLDDLIYLFDKTNFIDIILVIHFVSLIACVVFVTSWIDSKLLKWIHLIFIPLLIVIILYNGSHLLYGWYALYGVVCLISMKDDETSKFGLKESLELFTGIGLIYLMSIISILWI